MHRHPRRRILGLIGGVLALVVAMAVVPGVPVSSGQAATAGDFGVLPPPSGCVDGSKPDPQLGLEPNQIATAYGIKPLWDQGYQGQGVRMALIEPGQTYDPTKYQAFVDCWGAPVHGPTQVQVGDGVLKTAGEATFDVQVAVSMAPKLDGLYVVSSPLAGPGDDLPALIDAALDPANTGGTAVDVMSISFGLCESAFQGDATKDAAYTATEAALKRAADLGVKVFVAGGDSGSTGCAKHPVVPGASGTGQPSLIYPASSSWVTAVGGTQLDIDGSIETGGEITRQRVWHDAVDADTAYWGGGGGVSDLVALPTYQRTFGLSGAMIHKPDVAALAGPPKYPGGGIGTSGASPLTASGMAVVDSFLLGHGVAPPGFLNPLLYRLAATASYAQVFSDVTVGNNDLVGVGCCSAGPGYDEASGLGSIRFAGFAAYLLDQSAVTTTTTTVALPAAAPVAVTPAFTG